MGDWDTSTGSEPLPYLEFDVIQLFVHRKYVAANLKNNIALLRLKADVPLGRYPTIAPVCLPGLLFQFRWFELD
jgi:Trypsin